MPRPTAPEPPTTYPDPLNAKPRAMAYSAAGILGALYVDVQLLATSQQLDPDRLRVLAARVARDGMAASRRLKKAAEGGGDSR